MHADGCAKPELVKLMWLHKAGEPPEHPDHQITYDHDILEICPDCNGATVERLRHDCFDFEEVYDQYEWYELKPEGGAAVRAIVSRCETPLNPFCNCATHKSLRESVRTLPVTSWSAVFDAHHRHVVEIKDGKRPSFTLVASSLAGASQAPASAQHKPMDGKAVVFVVLAWPATLAAMLYLWFHFTNLPTIANVLIVGLAIPLAFVIAGIISAIVSLLMKRY